MSQDMSPILDMIEDLVRESERTLKALGEGGTNVRMPTFDWNRKTKTWVLHRDDPQVDECGNVVLYPAEDVPFFVGLVPAFPGGDRTVVSGGALTAG